MVLLDLLHVQRAGFFKFLKLGIDKELSQLNINVDNTRLQVIPFIGIQNKNDNVAFPKENFAALTTYLPASKRIEGKHSNYLLPYQVHSLLTPYSRQISSGNFILGTSHYPISLDVARLCKAKKQEGKRQESKHNKGDHAKPFSMRNVFSTEGKHPSNHLHSKKYLARLSVKKTKKDALSNNLTQKTSKLFGETETFENLSLNQNSCFRLIASKYTPREAILYQKSWSCKLVVKVLLTIHEKKTKNNTYVRTIPCFSSGGAPRCVRDLKSKPVFIENRAFKTNKSSKVSFASLMYSLAKVSNTYNEQVNYPLVDRELVLFRKSLNQQNNLLFSTKQKKNKAATGSSVSFVGSENEAFKKQQKNKQKSQKRDYELFLVLGELPLMTKRGHFIIHGSPRVILSQLIRTPGIYFTQKNNELQADCVPEQGPWLCIYKNISDGFSSELIPSVESWAGPGGTIEDGTTSVTPKVLQEDGNTSGTPKVLQEDSTNGVRAYAPPTEVHTIKDGMHVQENGKSNLAIGTKRNNEVFATLTSYVIPEVRSKKEESKIQEQNNEIKVEQSIVTTGVGRNKEVLDIKNSFMSIDRDNQGSYFCYTKQFSSMPFSLIYSTFRVFELHSQFTDQTLLLTKLKTLEKIRKFKEIITTLLTFTWKKRLRRRLQRLYTKRCFISTQQFEKTKLLFRLKKKLILGPLSRKSFNEKLGISSCINTGVSQNAFNNDFLGLIPAPNSPFDGVNKRSINVQFLEYRDTSLPVQSTGLTSLPVRSTGHGCTTCSPRIEAGKKQEASKANVGFAKQKLLRGSIEDRTQYPWRETDNFYTNGTDTCCFINNKFSSFLSQGSMVLPPDALIRASYMRSMYHVSKHVSPVLCTGKDEQQPCFLPSCFLASYLRYQGRATSRYVRTYPLPSKMIRSAGVGQELTSMPFGQRSGTSYGSKACTLYGQGHSACIEARKKHVSKQPQTMWLNSTTLLSRDLALIAHSLDGYKMITQDDIDDLNNQRIRTSSDQIQQQVRIGLFRFKKMFVKLIASGGASQTITDFLNGALREFFGSNPLSQFLDQTNPLAEITHKRRISKLGLGGIQRESATLKVRTIHSTYFGRICPIETPEGINAGLVNSLTCLSRVNAFGQLVTPLSLLIEGQKQEQFFYYSNQEKKAISTTDTALLRFQRLPNQFIYTKNESQFQQLEPNKVKLRVKSDLQTISLATALIPFLAYDDANRALMGSNMQRQAVPLILPERPIIRTGMESLVINESGHSFQSSFGGFVSYISAQYVVILYNTLNKRLLV